MDECICCCILYKVHLTCNCKAVGILKHVKYKVWIYIYVWRSLCWRFTLEHVALLPWNAVIVFFYRNVTAQNRSKIKYISPNLPCVQGSLGATERTKQNHTLWPPTSSVRCHQSLGGKIAKSLHRSFDTFPPISTLPPDDTVSKSWQLYLQHTALQPFSLANRSHADLSAAATISSSGPHSVQAPSQSFGRSIIPSTVNVWHGHEDTISCGQSTNIRWWLEHIHSYILINIFTSADPSTQHYFGGRSWNVVEKRHAASTFLHDSHASIPCSLCWATVLTRVHRHTLRLLRLQLWYTGYCHVQQVLQLVDQYFVLHSGDFVHSRCSLLDLLQLYSLQQFQIQRKPSSAALQRWSATHWLWGRTAWCVWTKQPIGSSV